MSAADDAVNAVSDQLGKAKGEIDALVGELEGQSVSADVLDRLRGVSQSLDDVVPDAAPEPEPTPDPEPAPDAGGGDQPAEPTADQ